MYNYFNTFDREGNNLAACAHPSLDPDLFFDGARLKQAKETCGGCPLKQACAEFAIKEKVIEGVWGGLSEEDRKFMRKRER